MKFRTTFFSNEWQCIVRNQECTYIKIEINFFLFLILVSSYVKFHYKVFNTAKKQTKHFNHSAAFNVSNYKTTWSVVIVLDTALIYT